MNKREAKRDACQHAALWLETCLDGQEIVTDPKVLEAMSEIVKELHRRGAGR